MATKKAAKVLANGHAKGKAMTLDTALMVCQSRFARVQNVLQGSRRKISSHYLLTGAHKRPPFYIFLFICFYVMKERQQVMAESTIDYKKAEEMEERYDPEMQFRSTYALAKWMVVGLLFSFTISLLHGRFRCFDASLARRFSSGICHWD